MARWRSGVGYCELSPYRNSLKIRIKNSLYYISLPQLRELLSGKRRRAYVRVPAESKAKRRQRSVYAK